MTASHMFADEWMYMENDDDDDNDDREGASTHVVAFKVELREVDGDTILSWSDDLPDAVLVRRIQLRERRTLNGAVGRVNMSSTRVCLHTSVTASLMSSG